MWMWAVTRVSSMCLLGAAAMMKMLVALLLFLGAGLAGVMAKAADDVEDQAALHDRELSKSAKTARDSLVQEAGGVAIMAICSFIVIAYVSSRERYLAPALAAGIIAGDIWFGVRFGFSWLPYMSIAGAVLAIAGWLALFLRPPPQPTSAG